MNHRQRIGKVHDGLARQARHRRVCDQHAPPGVAPCQRGEVACHSERAVSICIGRGDMGQGKVEGLRRDVARDDMLTRAGNARAIHVGPSLMAGLDRSNRERFFAKWDASVRASNAIITTRTGSGKT